MREIGEIMAKQFGKKPVFTVEENHAPRHMVGDIRIMTELLGPPTVRLADGINKMNKG
ncbi:MAG: hypothetical protein GY757_01130 [bacterium]|nr:hypothetical protein [bacterium]